MRHCLTGLGSERFDYKKEHPLNKSALKTVIPDSYLSMIFSAHFLLGFPPIEGSY
jgi:hypothetical protein